MPDRTCPDTCVKVRSDISDVLEEQCLCPTGSYFTNETCQDCGPFTYGQNCELTCNCEPNTTVSCAVRTGECTCLAGWSCSSCSEDVNECYTVYCGPNAYCLNTLGAYTCTCYPGFGRNSNGTCQRYYCHTTLRASSATIVSPNYPANYNNNDNCSWLITVEQTSIISIRFLELDTECNYDYVTVFDGMDRSRRLGAFCSITNLVLASTSNSMFVTFTSDEIVTKKGFLLSYNSFACPPLTYGPNCSYACNCDQNNTCYCNRTTGQCICKSGWTSYNCSRDVNEWANASNPSCPEFSSCSNLNGSYECLCYEGLQRDRDGLCDAKNDSICTRRNCSHVCAKIKNQDQRLVEHCYCPIGTEPIGDICQTCGNGTYGQDCNAKCDCVTENTASCNPVNGRCTCLPGWTSKACELDVNECYQYNIYFGSYSQCVNTPGSYECVCFPGYETSPYGNC